MMTSSSGVVSGFFGHVWWVRMFGCAKFNKWSSCHWGCESTHVIGSSTNWNGFGILHWENTWVSMPYFILIVLLSKIVGRSFVWGCGITIYMDERTKLDNNSWHALFCVGWCCVMHISYVVLCGIGNV